MESFPVICETCGARLKVRDARIVGEIHACPKCDSMVHIVPPAGWQSVSTVATVAQADPVTQPAPEVTELPMVTVDVITPPPLPPVAAAVSPLIYWGVGGSALLLFGLAIGVRIGGGRAGDEVKPLPAATDSTTQSDQPDPRDPDTVDPPIVAADAAREPPAPQVEPVAKTQAEEVSPTPALPELPAEEQRKVSDDVETATEAVADPPRLSEKNNGRPVAKTQADKQHVLKIDPLDFDPTRLSFANGPSSAASPATGSIAADPAADVELEASPDGAADDVLLPPPARDGTLDARLGPMPSDPAQPGKAREQLALRVDSLALTEVPLVRFVETLSEMAGVPITVDPLALVLAGASPRAAISVEATDTTIEDVLRDALLPHRLELVERERRIKVALAGGDLWRSVDYEVKDLAGDDAKVVADYVARFIAPATWQAAGGKGTVAIDGTRLHIEQAQAVHHEILVFCERLRLARGLAPRSRYPAERLSIDAPYDAIMAKLDQRTTFTFLPWARLADVVRFWQDSSDITILVDWAALADAELGPSSPIACSAIDRRWEEAFDGILEPIGLAWWAVDGDTIQITTPDALEKIQRIEFYAIPESWRDEFASGDAVIESLDEPSGRVIVHATPAVHRQLSQRLRGGAGAVAR